MVLKYLGSKGLYAPAYLNTFHLISHPSYKDPYNPRNPRKLPEMQGVILLFLNLIVSHTSWNF